MIPATQDSILDQTNARIRIRVRVGGRSKWTLKEVHMNLSTYNYKWTPEEKMRTMLSKREQGRLRTVTRRIMGIGNYYGRSASRHMRFVSALLFLTIKLYQIYLV